MSGVPGAALRCRASPGGPAPLPRSSPIPAAAAQPCSNAARTQTS